MLLALGAIAPATAHASALPPDFYGVNAQAVFSLPQDQWGPQLAAMRAAGLQVVRRDALWSIAEPNAPDPNTGLHTYVWDQFDAQVAALAQYGLRWYPIIDYSAPWASSVPGNPLASPANDADYVAYARAFAQRYGRNGDFWRVHPELPQIPVTAYEIWNEPNFDRYWQGGADRYADLYMQTRSALRQVDPQARVVVGGLIDWDGQAFIREMYRDRPELRGNVDAVGYHPYHLTATRVEGSIRALRDTLDSLGQPKVPIEVTEVGLLAPNSYTESLRAQLLSKLATDLPGAGLGVTRLIPHTWLAGAVTEPWGIWKADGTPLPSGASYAQAVLRERAGAAAAPATPVLHRGRVTVGAGGRARVDVVCRGQAGTCRGQVRIELPGAQAAGSGGGRFAIAAGRKVIVRVPLARRQRSLLQRKGRLRVRAYAVSPGERAAARRPRTLVLIWRPRSRA